MSSIGDSRGHRRRSGRVIRQFAALPPADALGIKQEFEKALAQDGRPPK
jgi:hypothetical protein